MHSPTSKIDLEPEDRFMVSWHDHEPLPRPESPAFDLGACLEKLRQLQNTRDGYGYDWSSVGIPSWPSVAEASFWLIARLRLDGLRTPQEVADELAQQGPPPKASANVALSVFGHGLGPLRDETDPFVRCGIRALSIEDLLDSRHGQTTAADSPVATLFRKVILPYLTRAERQSIRELVARHPILPLNDNWPASAWLRALFGLHGDLEPVLRALPDNACASRKPGDERAHRDATRWLVFGLASPARVREEFFRLGLQLYRPVEARAWLALTGLGGLSAFPTALADLDQYSASLLGQELRRVHDPAVASIAWTMLDDRRGKAAARDWMKDHPVETIVGLLPLAVGTQPDPQVRQFLRRKLSETGTLAKVRPRLTAEQAVWVDRI